MSQYEQRVSELTLELETSQRADLNAMDDLQRIGRLNAIRHMAEEVARSELLPPPESSADREAPSDPSGSGEQETVLSSLSREDRLWEAGAVLDSMGSPMPRDRSHPLWALWEASTSEDATEEQATGFTAAYRTWLQENPQLVD